MQHRYVQTADASEHDHVHGTWQSGLNIDVGDWYYNDTGLYECILAHTSSGGNAPPNATYWQKVAGPTTPLGSVNWRGTWSGATTYAAGDGVTYSGYAYVSIQNSNLNHQPPNVDWWALLGAISNPITLTQIATPSNPASGSDSLYFKSNDKLYRLTAAGVETVVGLEINVQTSKSAPVLADELGLYSIADAAHRKITLQALTDLLIKSDLYKNAIINSQFAINQQNVSEYTSSTIPANNDDTYAAPDLWNLLSDGNNIVKVAKDTSVIPTSGAASCRLKVVTANKKFGIVQFIENKDAIKFAGQAVSLQFKAATPLGNKVNNLRAAVLSWNSTADSLTSDVVSAWNAQGSNPTWAANWTAENTPANLALVADAWTTYKIENIAIDTASMTNLAVVIWCDDTDCAVDDVVYISDVQLNVGAVCLPYAPVSYQEDLTRCKRYLRCWGGLVAYERIQSGGYEVNATQAFCYMPFDSDMRVVPSLISSAASTFIAAGSSNVTLTALSIDAAGSTVKGVNLSLTAASGMSAGYSCTLCTNNTTSAYLWLDARL